MKNNHHANLVVGTPSDAERLVRSYFEAGAVEAVNNPDFVVIRVETFGIDEARELKRLSSRKAIGGHKFFLILSDRITLEAQNTLLKTFEDPSPHTSFFLVAREKHSIIPTLLSRMNTILVQSEGSVGRGEDFLSLTIRKRLTFASSFAEEKSSLAAFLDDLVLHLKKRGREDSLRKVYGIYRLLRGQNTGARVVIEHLALVL